MRERERRSWNRSWSWKREGIRRSMLVHVGVLVHRSRKLRLIPIFQWSRLKMPWSSRPVKRWEQELRIRVCRMGRLLMMMDLIGRRSEIKRRQYGRKQARRMCSQNSSTNAY